MAKNRQLRARVDEETYKRVESKTDKISDYVREAVDEKLEKDECEDESTASVNKKKLEVLLESRQTVIAQYRELIRYEESECEKLRAQIAEKDRIIEKQRRREENIKHNPAFKEEFDSAVLFLLRKKYLNIDGNVETVISNKARKLKYSRTNDFKSDLREYINKEWNIGRTFNIDGSNKEIIEADLNYLINRL